MIDFEVEGVRSGNVTYSPSLSYAAGNHRPALRDYAASLSEAAKVVLDADRRKEMIQTDAQSGLRRGLDLVGDGAPEESRRLVYVVLLGEVEEEFLAIPPEVIPPHHPRQPPEVFLARPQGGLKALANRFLLISTSETGEGRRPEIAMATAKVVRARLSDAVHFWRDRPGRRADLDQLKGSAEKLA